MKPKMPAAPARAGKVPEPKPGVAPYDEVFFHVKGQPCCGRVLATGKHGITVDHSGKQRRVYWSDVLGHKKRAEKAMSVVAAGEDGAILEDEGGRRTYVHGYQPPQKGGDKIPVGEMPRDGGPMRKAMPAVFMVADANELAKAIRPGLQKKSLTDKNGVQTTRWVKVGADQPRGPHNVAHGDGLRAKMGDARVEGHVVGAGKDGATVRDSTGRHHQVHWHEVTHHAVAPAGGGKGGGGKGGDGGDGEKPADPTKRDGESASPKDEGSDGKDIAAGGSADTIAKTLFNSDDMKDLPPAAVQPTVDKDDLYRLSGEALAQFKSWLDEGKGICDELGFETMKVSPEDADMTKPGGMLFIASLKGEKRATEKVESDYSGDWSKLIDTVRGTIAVDTMDDLKSTPDRLMAGGMKLARQPKNRFEKPTGEGYRDLLLNITLPNGIVGELQLHVKPMLAVKGEGHKHYETQRSLIAKHTDSEGNGTPPEDWPEGGNRALWDAFDAQKKIYGDAWAKVAGAGGSKKMRKAFPGGRLLLFLKGLMRMSGGYQYFEKDGAYFRKRKSLNLPAIEHVRHGDQWVPYKGDRCAPFNFGDEVPEEEATAGMRSRMSDAAD